MAFWHKERGASAAWRPMQGVVRTALVLASLAAAGTARAEVLTVTWHGTIGSGPQTDTLGLFGSVGANLAGKAFTAVVVFDNALLSYVTPYTGGTSGTVSAYDTGTTSTFGPPSAASFTVNNITLNFDTTQSCNNITQSVNQSGAILDLHTAAGIGCNTQNFYLDILGPNLNPDYTQDTNITVDASYTSAYGGATFHSVINGNVSSGVDNFGLTPTSLATVSGSQTQIVPEPATMTVLGFGLFGLAGLRRRRG